MRRPARRGPLLAWGGALALSGLAGPAAAQDGPYVRMGLGIVYTVSTADNRFRGLTLGLRYGF